MRDRHGSVTLQGVAFYFFTWGLVARGALAGGTQVGLRGGGEADTRAS